MIANPFSGFVLLIYYPELVLDVPERLSQVSRTLVMILAW